MKISVPFCGAAWYNDPEGFDFVCTSVLHDNERLFMSKYLTYLPTKEQLRTGIERQKEIFCAQYPALWKKEYEAGTLEERLG